MPRWYTAGTSHAPEDAAAEPEGAESSSSDEEEAEPAQQQQQTEFDILEGQRRLSQLMMAGPQARVAMPKIPNQKCHRASDAICLCCPCAGSMHSGSYPDTAAFLRRLAALDDDGASVEQQGGGGMDAAEREAVCGLFDWQVCLVLCSQHLLKWQDPLQLCRLIIPMTSFTVRLS